MSETEQSIEQTTYTHEEVQEIVFRCYAKGWDACVAAIRERGHRELAGKLEAVAFESRRLGEGAVS